jgi:hypothetical protein
MKLPEPYDQCLSSRRFILILEVNIPPSMSFIISIATLSLSPYGGAGSAPKIIDDCEIKMNTLQEEAENQF